MSLLKELDLHDLDKCRSVIADNFVWHYFNPKLPELEGDYCGVDGLKRFFTKLGERSDSSFKIDVIDGRPVGDELVVTQVCNQMKLDGNWFEFDALVIWRMVKGKISEAWDIPAVNTVRRPRRRSQENRSGRLYANGDAD